MIKLSLKLDVSSTKLLLGFVGVSATIGALYYLSHQNKTTKSLKSDDEVSTGDREKSGRLNGNKVGSENQRIGKIPEFSRLHVEDDHHNTSFACEGNKTLDNDLQSPSTEAKFTQNKDEIVSLDGSDVGSQVENNDNDKTKDDKPEVNKSPVKEYQDETRPKELNKANDAPNSREDKNIVGTKEENTLAEKSVEKGIGEANDPKKDTKESINVDKETHAVQNENSNNKSSVNENPEKSTTKELNLTNDSHNNCGDKNVDGTKKGPKLAEESSKKDTREANDREKECQKSCKFGTVNNKIEKVSSTVKMHAKNDHNKTNFACEGIQTLDIKSQSPNTEATFTQNKVNMVSLDGSYVGSQFENNNNDKTNKDKPEEKNSPVNENLDELRTKQLNVTNDSHNNCEDKNIVGTEEELELTKESTEKDTREANDHQQDTEDNESVDKEKQAVQNENPNHPTNDDQTVDKLNSYYENFKTLIQYLNVDVQQFKSLRSLLDSYVGKKSNRSKVFNRIKKQCQTYGEIYENIQGRFTYASLQSVLNQIFVLRTQLWKEVRCGEARINNSKVADEIESAKVLVDRLIEFLEQFKIAADTAIQSLVLMHKLLICGQTELTKNLTSVYSDYIQNLNSSLEKLDSCNCVSVDDDVISSINFTHFLIGNFFNQLNKVFPDFF